MDTIFRQAANLDMTHEQMAAASGCVLRTVKRIANMETYLPMLRTILRLARAVGMELTLVPTRKGRVV